MNYKKLMPLTACFGAATIAMFSLTLPVISPAEAAGNWSGTWGASPAFPIGQEIVNQTIRQYVKVSCGGDKVRVRFTNETGTQPLVIGDAHLALAATCAEKDTGAIVAGSDRILTFNGATSITVPPGAPAVSDPVSMPVAPLSSLAVSVFVPRWTGLAVVHPSGNQTGFISQSGDFCGVERMSGSPNKMRFFLSGVDVSSEKAAPVVVTFGDSITDGYGSTVDANKRWPDFLAARLNDKGEAFGVVNAGISGNRLLHDMPAAMFGPNALARFDRDALSVPGVSHIILLEGINDIGQVGSSGVADQYVDAKQIEAALTQLVERAHSRGVKVLGGTLLPFEGTVFAGYYSEAGEKLRQEVNAWIRNSGKFDGVVDFDAAVKDPQMPTKLRSDYDCGDHLHPNDAGYRAMAEAVGLKLLH